MKADGQIICNYNNMVLGDRLAVEGKAHYPVIYEGIRSLDSGPQEEVSYEGDVSVYIGSGTWESYIGGNYRDGDQSAIGIHRGTMNLEIAGGTFLDTQVSFYMGGTCAQLAEPELLLDILCRHEFL